MMQNLLKVSMCPQVARSVLAETARPALAAVPSHLGRHYRQACHAYHASPRVLSIPKQVNDANQEIFDPFAYDITIDLPNDLEPQNLKVELEQDGAVVHVSGERFKPLDHGAAVSHFSKRITLGSDVDVDNLQADLVNGQLFIRGRGPSDIVPGEGVSKQQVEIGNTNNNSKKTVSDDELSHRNYNSAFDESDWAETGKPNMKPYV